MRWLFMVALCSGVASAADVEMDHQLRALGGTVSATGITLTGNGELVLGQSSQTSCTTAGALVWDPVEVGGDPSTFGHYNVSRTRKMDLSAISDDTLFLRNDGRWLRMDRPAFDSALASSNTDRDWTGVTLTARNGATTTTAVSGYTNYNIINGGDYGVNSGAFDHHSTTYRHLNSNCASQYLYSYSSGTSDSDAGYDVNTSLGDWTVTAGCASAEGGSLVFRTAMR